MRLIDADALLQRWNDIVPRMVRDKDGGIPIDFLVVIHEVGTTPTLTLDDLMPKGRWIKRGYACGENEYECSVCHETEWRTSASRMKYCMFCGARMDGGDKNDE